MTKDEAKRLLEGYLINECLNESFDTINLPIKDEIVYEYPMFNVYTFIGLICIAYDLQEKPK